MLDFKGRASRREFWFTVTPVALWNVLLVWLLGIVAPDGVKSLAAALFVLIFLIMLPDAFAGAAVVRRLHDFGRSGYWILVVLVPCHLVSALHNRVEAGWERAGLLALGCAMIAAGLAYVGSRKGHVGPNPYGPDPLSAASRSAV